MDTVQCVYPPDQSAITLFEINKKVPFTVFHVVPLAVWLQAYGSMHGDGVAEERRRGRVVTGVVNAKRGAQFLD